MENSSGNQIGGTTAAARNVISANGGAGVDLVNSGAAANTVQGNFIGTRADGVAALPNASHGVLLTGGAGQNVIGGTAAGAGNRRGRRGSGAEFESPRAAAGADAFEVTPPWAGNRPPAPRVRYGISSALVSAGFAALLPAARRAWYGAG